MLLFVCMHTAPRRPGAARTGASYDRGHTNPPHPHTSDLICLNDLNCSEESSVLRAFSELLHLIISN